MRPTLHTNHPMKEGNRRRVNRAKLKSTRTRTKKGGCNCGGGRVRQSR